MQSDTWHVTDEWAPIHAVMVGTGIGMGDAPTKKEIYDPQSLQHVLNNTYPSEDEVTKELDELALLLENHGAVVTRPDLVGVNQVFTRDIAMVIDNRMILTHMVEDRKKEQAGLKSTLQANLGSSITPPANVKIEGGDVLVMPGELWVGYSKASDFDRFTTARTNEAGINWLQDQFPNRKVRGFELQKSDLNPLKNSLHLDCCLAPLGMGHVIYYPGGFKNPEDLLWIQEQYPKESRLELSAREMANMECNFFSITPNKVISSLGFDRTKDQMKHWGYQVIEVNLSETAKMGGLIRCSTMPLRRNLKNS